MKIDSHLLTINLLKRTGKMLLQNCCLRPRQQNIMQKNTRSSWKMNLNLFVFTLAFISYLVYRYQCYKITFRHPYILHSLSSQSEQLHDWISNGTVERLQHDSPALTVHYLWCRKGHFEFKHYLSILSILKSIQPDQIVFHYTHLPLVDQKGYVTWFEDIQRDVPFLIFKKISKSNYCGHSFFDNMNFELADLNNPVGIFVTEDIAVFDFTRNDFIDLAKSSQRHSNVRAFLFPSSEPFLLQEDDGVKVMTCPSIKAFNIAQTKLPCVQMTERLSPTDTWHRKEPFYSYARSLFYGSKSLQPLTHNSFVPLHCHILHFTDSFDYMAYSSVLSALYVGKMTHVYIHSNHVPVGHLYEEAITKHNVTFVHVPHVDYFHPKLGDILYGAYVLLRHGGVIVRSDTIWHKEMPQELRAFDSVATLRRSIYRIINYSIDLSVLISQANSEFLKLFLTTLRQTPKRHSEANDEEVAYRVYIETPQSVKLHSMLTQHVTCSKNLCQPTPEDGGVTGAVLVQMSWKDGRPKSESDIGHYRGIGVNLMKSLTKN